MLDFFDVKSGTFIDARTGETIEVKDGWFIEKDMENLYYNGPEDLGALFLSEIRYDLQLKCDRKYQALDKSMLNDQQKDSHEGH